jgi:YVTN family beta-propeller protein
VVATIPSVGDFPYGIAVNPAGTYVYVTDWAFSSRTGLVKIIDASSNTLLSRTVPVGNSPVGIGVSPSGGRVYVANTGSGTVSVIDTATNTVPSGGTLPVGTSPTGIAVSPSGLVVYVARQGGGVSSPGGVSSIWAPTNTILANVPIVNSPFGVATDPAGARFFVGNQDGTVSVIDASTNAAVGPPVTVGNGPIVLGAFVGGTPSAPPCDDQLASLRQQLDAANATVASLQDQVTRLGNQITQLRADKAALQTQLDSALSRLAAANDTIASLNATITNLGNQVTQLTADKATLQAQLASLQNEYAQLKSDLAAANATIAAQNQTLTSFVNHLFGAKVDVYVATAARDASYQALSQAVTKLGVANPRVREAQREYRDGLNDLAAGHYQRAVVHFRQACMTAERSLKH